jgi:hypothetical protein
MAERFVPLLATQVAPVQFPVPARPTFRVEKMVLFCNPASGGTFSSTAVEIIKWVKKIAEVKVSHILSLEIPHSKNSLSLLMVSKDSIEGYMR